MNKYNAIQTLTLTRNTDQPWLINYSAEMSFVVSFGKMNFNISGSLDAEFDKPQSVILDAILNAAFEDLKKRPVLFDAVSRNIAWENAGKPEYVAWCMEKYPSIFSAKRL